MALIWSVRRRRVEDVSPPLQPTLRDSAVGQVLRVATSSKTTRSEKILESLTLRNELSPEGRDFLIASLDPMHDNPIQNLQGWPDLETASSVVRCIKQSMTISNMDATGPWDAHIVQWPWMSRQKFCQPVRRNNELILNNIGGPAGPIHSAGGLCVYYNNIAAGSVNFNREPNAYLDLNDAYSSGPSRIIGLGFEVQNTTAELYRQGQVFVWRLPEPAIEPSNYNFRGNKFNGQAGGYTLIPFDGQIVMCPPRSSNDAMLIPGTRQWRAEEGCYIVGAHIGQDNPPLFVDYVQPLMKVDQNPDVTHGESGPGSDYPLSICNQAPLAMPVPLIDSAVDMYFPAFRMYPLHLCGALFAGLSPQTTLTVTWNVYLETFPTVADPNILVLATPSATYDPVALQLYSHALVNLPVGVPAGWNEEGDWFADLVMKVTDFVTPVSLAFGLPEVSAASALAGKIASGFKAAPTPNSRPTPPPEKKQKKEKQKQQRKPVVVQVVAPQRPGPKGRNPRNRNAGKNNR